MKYKSRGRTQVSIHGTPSQRNLGRVGPGTNLIQRTLSRSESFHRLQPLSFLERKTIDKESEEVTLLVSVRKLLRAAYFYTIASSVSFRQNRRTKATYALINQTIWVGRNLLFHYQDHTGAASFTRQPYEK